MDEIINSLLNKNLGCQLISCERIGGGRNSQIFKLNCDNKKSYVAKHYLKGRNDNRDRIGVEFSSIEFMWKNQIREIPQAYFIDRAQGIAIYEFIDGACFKTNEITEKDIDDAVEFLGKLEKLKNAERSSQIPKASEAFFSVKDVVGNILARKTKLDTIKSDDQISIELRRFLENEFDPAFIDVVNWSKNRLVENGLTFEGEISLQEKTLSPSDFGFHNALKRDNGQTVFLDFEYFGWDDPAKMVSDFLLHPNPLMQVDNHLKTYFIEKMVEAFGNYPGLFQRVKILYPLFGLKWCMIILNEFVPEFLYRREFADGGAQSRECRQKEQLEKARILLEKLLNHYEEFSYYD